MPSSMIHLLVARKVRPGGSPLFLAGNLAPDGVNDRESKDRSHFRSCPDRETALLELAKKTPSEDDYGQGVLLHLFVDWLWDGEAFVPYKRENEAADPGWFAAYRREISLASTWIFHHCGWADEAFRMITEIPLCEYGGAEAVTPEAAGAYIRRTCQFHRENQTPPSSVFTPEFVERFAGETALRYLEWRRPL